MRSDRAKPFEYHRPRARWWGSAAVVLSCTLIAAPTSIAAVPAGPGTVAPMSTAAVMSADPGVGAPARSHEFVSRPDLTPPVVNLSTPANGTDPGYVFLAPRGQGAQTGPMIIDDQGQPVWSKPVGEGGSQFPMGLQVQQYQGQPVLTWWQGEPAPGYGHGEYVIMNQQYEQIATVRTGNGLDADLHEMTITPRDTALIMSYHRVQRERPVIEGVIQEVDIATGDVLFEWHSLDHIGLDESVLPPPGDLAADYDYFHLNSIAEDADGNLLISARHTGTIYQLDRATGVVDWRLGGTRSDFALGDGTGFAWQHDARWRQDGQLSLFDNASLEQDGPPSRALVLNVDLEARTAELDRAFVTPDNVTSTSQGNHQVLSSGHSFVGWGSRPSFTEYDRDGAVRMHGTFGDGMQAYRAFRQEWHGHPAEPPSVVAEPAADGATSVYTSWNGSTETQGWRILTGPSAEELTPVTDAAKAGFETQVDIEGVSQFVAAEPLDSAGNPLGRSEPVLVPALRS